jgi:glyoxylase-like metal-dependent hydrolase (beta-lactamase superfamily II)
MSNNAYLLRCNGTGEQVLIDAADEPERLLPLVGDAGLTTVVTTHRHWDHHRALAAVVEATGAEVVAGHPTPTRSRPRPAYPSRDASRTATPSRSATAPSR